MISTFLLLLFAWQVPASAVPQDVARHMQAGIAAEQQQKFEQAIAEFLKATDSSV
jgi:hypothetical protein